MQKATRRIFTANQHDLTGFWWLRHRTHLFHEQKLGAESIFVAVARIMMAVGFAIMTTTRHDRTEAFTSCRATECLQQEQLRPVCLEVMMLAAGTAFFALEFDLYSTFRRRPALHSIFLDDTGCGIVHT